MWVDECVIGGEYVINGKAWVLTSRNMGRSGCFTLNGDTMLLPMSAEVNEVAIFDNDRWVRWHDEIAVGVNKVFYNNDVWVKVRDL